MKTSLLSDEKLSRLFFSKEYLVYQDESDNKKLKFNFWRTSLYIEGESAEAEPRRMNLWSWKVTGPDYDSKWVKRSIELSTLLTFASATVTTDKDIFSLCYLIEDGDESIIAGTLHENRFRAMIAGYWHLAKNGVQKTS